MVELSTHELAVLQAIRDRFEGKVAKNLGTPLFHFCSSLVPSVNVDILLFDLDGRFILTWRDDEFYGPGWHVPGGVVRHKETWLERAQKVAESECGVSDIDFEDTPRLVQQVFNENRCVRGHFVSILFIGHLKTSFLSTNIIRSFSSQPENLINEHKKLYMSFLREL